MAWIIGKAVEEYGNVTRLLFQGAEDVDNGGQSWLHGGRRCDVLQVVSPLTWEVGSRSSYVLQLVLVQVFNQSYC